jgi:aldehyde:ferredoxin oxidoreductase
MESKGLEFGGYECRGLTGQSLQYAVSTRGGCHHAFGLVARAEVANGTRLQVEGKGAQVIKAATQRVLRDSLAACTFPGQILTDSLMPAIYSALYGEKIDDEELSIAALRIMTQERIINMREGLTRADDTLPARLLNEPKVDGPTKGVVVPLESLKDDFYRKIGWDIVTGNPSKDFIRNLGVIG